MRTNSHAPKALIFALALSASLLGGPPPSPLRYDLSPGDHLVYHEFLERESQGTDWSALTKTELTSHLLVIGEDSGHVEVGFARDRARAELVRYVERGHDRTKREEAGFAHDLESRDPHFAEANWLTKTGASILPWSALREWPSEVLPALREVEPFPTEPVDLGSTWRDTTMLGLLHRAAAWETKDGKNCLRVEASRVGAPLSLRYWFSPETGVLVALEFDGHYPAPGRSIHETLRLELVERRRKEDLSQWLSDPDLQRGALAALFISDAPPPDPARLHGLLGRGDAAVDGSVLSLLYRRHWPPPPLEVLGDLARPPHPARLRGLALRALESLPPGPEAQAILAPALVDPDDSVRDAAFHYVRERLPSGSPVRDAEGALAAWGRLSSRPLEGNPILAAWGRAVLGTGPLPPWQGEGEGWPERIALAQRFPGQVPGTTLRQMTKEGYWGWPYVIRVPEEYRGDEPFPLVIMLSGGPGRAVEGAVSAEAALSQTHALVLFPHAKDNWWGPASTALVPALLDEILRTFNVDTNRVFLTGFSNGGTGAFAYATLWPHRLAAVVPLMGAGRFAETEQPLRVSNVGALPFLLLHGDKDDVIAPKASVETADLLHEEAPQAFVRLEILKNVGHEITLGSDGGRTIAFLRGRRRDPFPRKVHLEIDTLAFPRRYWIEVVDKDSGTADVRGELLDDGTIRLKTHNVRRLKLLLRRELVLNASHVHVLVNGREAWTGPFREDTGLLERTFRETADPFLAYSAEVVLDPSR